MLFLLTQNARGLCGSPQARPMASVSERGCSGPQEQKLVFSTAEHPTTLQKHLHRQWTQGQNCDLIISARSCDIPVHSCVASCFSAKIQRHLLHACAWDSAAVVGGAQDWYSTVEDGIQFSFRKSGEKRVGVDVHHDVVKLLVGFMYTGSLSIPRHQTLALLAIAQGLGVTVVVDMVQVFINRNPDVASSQTLAATSKQSCLPHGLPDDARNGCAVAEAGGGETLEDDGGTLCLDPLEVDIKKEMVDADFNVLFNKLSSRVQRGEGATGSVGGGLPPAPDSSDKDECGAAAVGEKVRGNLVVKIEQEVFEDFPVHFESTSPQQTKRQQHNANSRTEPCSVHSSDDDDDNENADNDNNDDDDIYDNAAVAAAAVVAADNPEDGAARPALGNRPFVCTYCTRSYGSRACLHRHVLRVHNSKVFQRKTCPHCDEQFQLEEGDRFKAHCREAHGDLVCEVAGCEYRTTHLNQMRSHKSRAHGVAYPCSKCSHLAPSKGSLLKHRLHSHAPYSCPVCHRSFLRKENFTRHSRAAHSRDEHQCPWCRKCFSSSAKLVRHRRKCHGGVEKKPSLPEPDPPEDLKPVVVKGVDALHPSSLCSFSKSGLEGSGGSSLDQLLAVVHRELSQEMSELQEVKDGRGDSKQSVGLLGDVGALPPPPLRPKGLKPSSRKRRDQPRSCLCLLCNKQVESPEAHYQHLREKHRDASFPCPQCPKSFVRKEGLTLHVRAEHHCRSWACPHCAQVFTVSTQFLAHCTVQHGDPKPFRCPQAPLCRFRASSLKSVEGHKKHVHVTERNEVCGKCGSRFPTQRYLRLHQRACLQLEQHLCPTCGEVFSLRQSLLSHINNKHGGERRYGCSQCGQRFSCHANRNRHMRIHNNDFPYMCEVCGQKFRHSNSLKDHTRRKHGTGG